MSGDGDENIRSDVNASSGMVPTVFTIPIPISGFISIGDGICRTTKTKDSVLDDRVLKEIKLLVPTFVESGTTSRTRIMLD